MENTNDKTTIGLTNENKIILERIKEKNYFKDEMDIAKFAMSYAIIYGEDEVYTASGYGTKWNVGTFDNGNKLRTLLSVLMPENNEPYRQIEELSNKGLFLIGKHIEKNNDLFIEEILNIKF